VKGYGASGPIPADCSSQAHPMGRLIPGWRPNSRNRGGSLGPAGLWRHHRIPGESGARGQESGAMAAQQRSAPIWEVGTGRFSPEEVLHDDVTRRREAHNGRLVERRREAVVRSASTARRCYDMSAVAKISGVRHAIEQRWGETGLGFTFDVKAMDKGEKGVHGRHVNAERAGGARWSGRWRGRDAALTVGFGARSKRLPGMHWEKMANGTAGLGPHYSGTGWFKSGWAALFIEGSPVPLSK
jgi:hypothetical protein